MKINEKRQLVFLREKQNIYSVKIEKINKEITKLIDAVNIENITEENKTQYAKLENQRQQAIHLLVDTTQQLNLIYSKLN